MKRNALLAWVLGGAGLAYLLYSQRQQVASGASAVESDLESGVEDVKAALTGWQAVNQGPVWVPVIQAAEAQFGIPTNLLARIAYQESRFRPEYIDGTKASSAGALGIMQLMPYFGSKPGFATVRVPIPFSDADTAAQIQEAAQELVRLFNHYGDWGLAVAAYNDGQANIDSYLARTRKTPLPQETLNYVAQVFTDVPVTGATILQA